MGLVMPPISCTRHVIAMYSLYSSIPSVVSPALDEVLVAKITISLVDDALFTFIDGENETTIFRGKQVV